MRYIIILLFVLAGTSYGQIKQNNTGGFMFTGMPGTDGWSLPDTGSVLFKRAPGVPGGVFISVGTTAHSIGHKDGFFRFHTQNMVAYIPGYNQNEWWILGGSGIQTRLPYLNGTYYPFKVNGENFSNATLFNVSAIVGDRWNARFYKSLLVDSSLKANDLTVTGAGSVAKIDSLDAGYLFADSVNSTGRIYVADDSLTFTRLNGDVINCALGNVFRATLDANDTLGVSNMLNGQIVSIVVTNASTYTLAWSGVNWAGGTPPTLSATANKRDVFTLIKAGGIVYGSAVQDLR